MNRSTPGLPAAAAAKSPQSCLTRCDPTDGPNRLLCPWDSSGKNTGVGCHFLLHCMKVKVKSLSRVRLLATPWTVTYQAPLSVGFSRQEYWSGLPFPSAGDLPSPGIEPASPVSPALAGRFFTTESPGKPNGGDA